MIAEALAVLLLVVFYLCGIVAVFLLFHWQDVRPLLSWSSSVAASAVLPSARVGRGRSFQDTEVMWDGAAGYSQDQLLKRAAEQSAGMLNHKGGGMCRSYDGLGLNNACGRGWRE